MRKPTVYPAPKDMSIKALKSLIQRLELEQSEKVYDEYCSVERDQTQAIKNRGIPEFFNTSDKPRKSITEIKEKYYPYVTKGFENRERWLTDKDFCILLFEGLFWSGSIPLIIFLAFWFISGN